MTLLVVVSRVGAQPVVDDVAGSAFQQVDDVVLDRLLRGLDALGRGFPGLLALLVAAVEAQQHPELEVVEQVLERAGIGRVETRIALAMPPLPAWSRVPRMELS